MSPLLIPATPSHLDEIAAIQVHSARRAGAMGFYDLQSRQELRDLIHSESVPFVVAEKNDQVVGYAYGLQQDISCVIDQIAVSPDLRGSGLGRKLVGAIADEVAGQCDTLVAEIISDNTRSQAFFQKNGFEHTERRRGPESGLHWQIWSRPVSKGLARSLGRRRG